MTSMPAHPQPTGRTHTVLPDGRTVAHLNDAETRHQYREIFVDHQYAPDGFPPLPPRPVVFDVGANIGLFTLYVLGQRPDASVYAFEPVPQIHEILSRNLEPYPSATARQVALGRFPGRTAASYYPRYTMMSGLRADPEYDHATAKNYLLAMAGEGRPGSDEADLDPVGEELLAGMFEPVTVPCEVQTVGGAMASLGVDRLDLLKIDVERYELDVLLGVDDAVWPRIGHVVMEVDDRAGELDAVCELLGGHGMVYRVAQGAEYRRTNLHMVYAGRSVPAGRAG